MKNLLLGRISCRMRRYRKFPDIEIIGARQACLATCFCWEIFCALPTALLRPLMTIHHAKSGLKLRPIKSQICIHTTCILICFRKEIASHFFLILNSWWSRKKSKDSLSLVEDPGVFAGMGEGGGEGDKHLYYSQFASPSPLSPPLWAVGPEP